MPPILGGLYIDGKYVEAVGDKKMNFEPENLAEYIGHDDPNNPLFYVDEWESDSPQCLMLDGAPGLGKTTAAYLIGKYLELDIVEYTETFAQ